MFTLTLNDETVVETEGAGASDGFLWIYGLKLGFVEIVQIFSDSEKTQRMIVHYQESLPDDVFEGYTNLRNVMRYDQGIKVCLEK